MLAHLHISSSDLARSLPELSPKFAQMENSTAITKSDWLFTYNPIPNAKFQPITLQ